MSPYSAVARKILSIRPSSKHTASVIFLHGRGSTGLGIMRWLYDVGFKPLNHVKYIFPTAPVVRYSTNGIRMPCWFDVLSKNPKGQRIENENDVKRSASFVDELIAEEKRLGIPSSRIIVGGFSQGGSIALYWAATRPVKVAGIVALSTWLPCSGRFPRDFKGDASNSTFVAHGTVDPRVPLSSVKETHDVAKKLLPNTTFKSYDGLEHQLGREEISDVSSFISTHLPENL